MRADQCCSDELERDHRSDGEEQAVDDPHRNRELPELLHRVVAPAVHKRREAIDRKEPARKSGHGRSGGGTNGVDAKGKARGNDDGNEDVRRCEVGTSERGASARQQAEHESEPERGHARGGVCDHVADQRGEA